MYKLDKASIFETICQRHEDLKQYSVEQIGLFGSFVNDNAKETSDIDLLVHFGTKTFRNYMGLKLFLEDLFGREVDLVTPEAVRPELKDIIMNEVEYVQGPAFVS